MRKSIIILTILITGCTGYIKFPKYIPDNYENYNVFICKAWGSNKFYGATTKGQAKMLTTKLKVKIWKGYWDGMPEDGIIITKNNNLISEVYSNVIRKSNIVEFKDSLQSFTKKYRKCDKVLLVHLLDSLKKTATPYFMKTDTASFYGEQYFKINYNIGENKFPSKREWTVVKLTNDSILSNFQSYFSDRKIHIGTYTNTRDGNIELNLAITANKKKELKTFDNEIYSKIKSVKQVSLDKFEPIQYYIYYFTKD